MERLMVIIPDRLSDLVRKGEITDRYYNPGDLFGEVHIVMTNDDRPDANALQPTVGSAKLFLHNLPTGTELFLKTLGWRPPLLRRWTELAVALAANIKPNLIRCYGARLNAFAARAIKRRLGIPCVVSLHTNPDTSVRGGPLRAAVMGYASAAIEKDGLLAADLVLPVYKSIEPFLRRVGVKHYRVAYNVINPTCLAKKDIYTLHKPVRIISVGRLIPGKNPKNLIRAVAELEDVELTVVGDGPIRDALRRLVAELGVGARVVFRPVVSNDELCTILPDYDIFAIHSDYLELSKSMLEALLTGLPSVVNRRAGAPVPELTSDICRLAEGSTDAYRVVLQELIANDLLREGLGRSAHAHANAHWSPQKSEAVFVDVYRNILSGA